MNVKSRQQENAEATREALLESALSAFIEHGYGGVSIDAIAREARVTKGAFYHHFGSKQELLAECYERQVRTIAEDLDRVPAHVDKWAEAAALAEAFIDSVMARGKRQLSL
ncbi:TPA: TetR/AcrR family transcriptional regulator, partial [Pseudomonas aeruginosa]